MGPNDDSSPGGNPPRRRGRDNGPADRAYPPRSGGPGGDPGDDWDHDPIIKPPRKASRGPGDDWDQDRLFEPPSRVGRAQVPDSPTPRRQPPWSTPLWMRLWSAD